jgi:tetratricopeptide (TPR) repeat protein
MILRTLLPALALLAAVTSAAAQHPERPPLPRGADLNDWEAYYDEGVRMLNHGRAVGAQEAFYWSARLDPSRADPLYALRVAIFLDDLGLWDRYLRDEPGALRNPRALRADSLMGEAMLRNPFVPRSLNLLLYGQLPGQWGHDPTTRGWLAFAKPDVEAAVGHFTRAVESHPQSVGRRMDLAQALVALGRMDEAAAQVSAVLAELRRRDERELVRVYESKEMLEYSLALLCLSAGRDDEAREALERALVESAAAYQAHRGLALLARVRRDPARAAEESGRAVEIAGPHPLLDFEYGAALVEARRPAEAVPILERVVRREPFWADARLELGRAYEGSGRRGEALAAYERYLELAPRADASRAAAVRRRMERLRAAPAAPPPPG